MWIQYLKLQNIRCFDDIEIDFKESSEVPRKFTLLIGENGGGKSTLLKALAMAAVGPRSLPFLVPDARRWVRNGEGKAFIEAAFVASRDDDGSRSPIHVRLEFSSQDRNVTSVDKEMTFLPLNGWLTTAYGPFRAPPSWTERRRMTEDWDFDPRAARVANLFQPQYKLESVDSWMKELEYKQLKTGRDSFDIFLRAIEHLLPANYPVKYSHIDPEGFAIFETPFGKSGLDGLSDAYASMLVWASDFLRNIMKAFPMSQDPLNRSGILLLDELDVHLHPRWQREIVAPLTKLFPNIQLITTTHSPLVLQGVKAGKVILCRREGSKITLDDDLPSIEGWRADELLEDKFFGVDAYDNETQAQLDEHRRLLAKSNLTADDEEHIKNLVEDLRAKRVVESSDIFKDEEYDRTQQSLREIKKSIDEERAKKKSSNRRKSNT